MKRALVARILELLLGLVFLGISAGVVVWMFRIHNDLEKLPPLVLVALALPLLFVLGCAWTLIFRPFPQEP